MCPVTLEVTSKFLMGGACDNSDIQNVLSGVFVFLFFCLADILSRLSGVSLLSQIKTDAGLQVTLW